MVASLLFKWITSCTNYAIVLKLFSWHCFIRSMITFTDGVRNMLDWQQAIRDGETKLGLSLLPDGDDPAWYPQDSYRRGSKKRSRDTDANPTISKWVILIYKNNIHVHVHVIYSGNVYWIVSKLPRAHQTQKNILLFEIKCHVYITFYSDILRNIFNQDCAFWN
jgi:hypothetical protein